jgi:alkaline phosphatase D
MPAVNVPVQWQLATDPNMRNVVRRGTAMATPELAHSIRVVLGGLKSAQWYWYQFKAGNEVSPIGRTRTAPALGTPINQLNFAFASCQMYEHGYFTAYKYMAQESLDLVVHLGDYIYEYGPNEYQSEAGNIRVHNSPEIISLEDYRNRYALYKSDPDLQALMLRSLERHLG